MTLEEYVENYWNDDIDGPSLHQVRLWIEEKNKLNKRIEELEKELDRYGYAQDGYYYKLDHND